MRILSKFGGVFLYFLAIIFIPLSTEAAQLSFRIDPAKIRLIIPAGGSRTGIIKVYTQSEQNIKIKAYLQDWAYGSEQDGTKAFFPANTTPLSSSGWINFSPSEFVIPAYGVGQVSYSIKVPPDAEGGHFSVMFFEAGPLSQAGSRSQSEVVQATTTLSIRLGALFFIEAQDKSKRAIDLSKFSISEAPKKKGILITGDFKNVGNTDITAGGTFYIMNKKGKIFVRGNFNDVYTFPQDKAKLRASFKDPLATGKYVMVISLDLGKVWEGTNVSRGRGPIITKEAEIEIGENAEVLRVGDFK